MEDFIDKISYYGLSARIKRLSDTLNMESRSMNAYLNFDIEPNWHLIFLSLKNQALSVTEISAQLQFSHPAIVKIITKMKARGYVKSIQDKTDSRKQLLSLTAKSKKMLPEFEKAWAKIQQILNECTTNDFINQIQFFEAKIKEKSILERLKEAHSKTNSTYNILNCSAKDIPLISKTYTDAIALMKSKNQVHWPHFSKSMIENEIEEKRIWKMLINKKIACIWSITYIDPIIWGEKSNEPSIYIHKIATIPEFYGSNLVSEIVIWAKDFAKKNSKKYIRMDTVGNNKSLIKHYKKNGFKLLRIKKLTTTQGLPDHYNDGNVCYFEIKL